MSRQLSIREPFHSKLKTFLQRLKEKYAVRAIVIFGSIAKGTANYRSDIDILIVSDDIDNDWFQRHQKVYALSPGKIQPFVFTSEEFQSALENRQYVAWEALYDGIVLEDDGIFQQMRLKIKRLIEKGLIEKENGGWIIRKEFVKYLS